jgi:precorrin-6Y C5,15-methyltransferase (decarboxylating)
MDAEPAPVRRGATAEAWLTVIGALPGGALAPTAPATALEAEAVFGPARLLEAAGVAPERQRAWPSPFSEGVAALLGRRGRPTTVIASGDPLHHGIAATLLAHLAPEEMIVHPAPSAFSLAAAALRWPLAEALCVSLHAADPEEILAHAAPGRRLLVLTRDGEAPARIAAVLAGAGWGDSPVAVCEALGGPEAAVHRATAATLAGRFHPLNTLGVHCRRPDPVRAADLEHDGCITRDEVRAVVLAALAPFGGHLWDVGAGSGSVAVAWCRAGGTATLFEREADRAAAARRNIAGLAARLLEGEAADRIAAAPPPERIFLGGAVAEEALFAILWDRLLPGGILVANAVTLDGEAALIARHARLGGTLTRIALSHAVPVGRLLAMKPGMPVLSWRVVKPAGPDTAP